MNAVVVAVAVGALLAIAHLVLYRFLRDGDRSFALSVRRGDLPRATAGDGEPESEGEEPGAEVATLADPPDGVDAGTRCPICGTINDPGFTFCRQCVAKLGEGSF